MHSVIRNIRRSRLIIGLVLLSVIGALLVTIGPLSLGSYSHPSHASNQATGLNTDDPVLFIHGFNGAANAGCNAYGWDGVKQYAATSHTLNGTTPLQWNPDALKTVGFYSGDQAPDYAGNVGNDCDVNLNFSTSAAAVDARAKCASVDFSQTWVGTSNESIKHLACELAWFIYDSYEAPLPNAGTNGGFQCPAGKYPCNVQIVAHSMGGLIMRWAMGQSGVSGNSFPPQPLYVKDVIEFSTPNGGISASEASQLKAASSFCEETPQDVSGGSSNGQIPDEFRCGQLWQMMTRAATQEVMNPQGTYAWSPPALPFAPSITHDLVQQAGYPQGTQGTRWTMFGAPNTNCGSGTTDLGASTATAMDAGSKVWFTSGCYNPGGPHLTPTMLQDTANGATATALLNFGCDQSPIPTSCSQDPTEAAPNYPHPLCRMLYALTEPQVPVHAGSACENPVCGTIASDPFDGSVSQITNGVLGAPWTQAGPTASATLAGDASTSSGLQISANAGTDLYPGTNFNAPRILQTISGDSYIVETTVVVDPTHVYQGAGILIWQDQNTYIRLERGFGGVGGGDAGVRLDIESGGSYRSISPSSLNPTTATSIGLRIQRSGSTITAWWRDASNSSNAWQQLPQTPFTFNFVANVPVQTGLAAVNFPTDGYTGTLDAQFGYFRLTCAPATLS